MTDFCIWTGIDKCQYPSMRGCENCEINKRMMSKTITNEVIE